MREIQFRDALREAMTEEMRKDENIFLMGEEVADYNGAYKVSQGMLDEFGHFPIKQAFIIQKTTTTHLAVTILAIRVYLL